MAVNPAPVVVPVEKTWKPTNKWLAELATLVGALAVSYLTTDGWGDEENGIAAAGVAALIATYFAPNKDTPGGVPVKPAEG